MKGTAKQIGIILLASAALAVVANLIHPHRIAWVQDWSHQIEAKAADQGIPVAPVAVAWELYQSDGAVFIDARPSADFGKGHIPGAVSIPLEQLDAHLQQIIDLLIVDQKLMVYCSNRECDDALLLATELKAMGVANIVLLVDGYEGWVQGGAEVER